MTSNDVNMPRPDDSETGSVDERSKSSASEDVAEVVATDVSETATDLEVSQREEDGEQEPSSEETTDEAAVLFDLERSVALLEALLLAHGEPIPLPRLQDAVKCTREQLNDALGELKKRCAAPDRGAEVVVVAGKIQLRTKAAFADSVRELMAVKPKKLSQAALETLAVIAYQQPVVKSEVDKIRGVDVAPTIKTLLERKLVKIIGYQASVGQPALYGTTEEFLKIFGLKGLTDLPNLRDLKAVARDPGETDADDDNGDDTSVESDGGEPAAEESATAQQ